MDKTVELTREHREDIRITGRGTAMAVIAYLDGNEDNADDTERVHPALRGLLNWFNGLLRKRDRFVLIPYIFRALNAQPEPDLTAEELNLVVQFAGRQVRLVESERCFRRAKENPSGFDEYARQARRAGISAIIAAQHAQAARRDTVPSVYACAAVDFAVLAVVSARVAAESGHCGDVYYEATLTAFLEFLDRFLPTSEDATPDVWTRLEKLQTIAAHYKTPSKS